MSEGVEVVVVAEVVGDRVAVHPLVSRPPPRRMARPQMEATSRSRWFLGRPSSALDMVSPCWPAPGAQDQGPRWRRSGAPGLGRGAPVRAYLRPVVGSNFRPVRWRCGVPTLRG